MVEQEQDQNHVLQAHHAAWSTNWRRAEFSSANRHARTGLKIYKPDKHGAHADIYAGHDPGVCCRWTLGVTSWFLGFPDQAETWLVETLALARRREHPYTLLIARMICAFIHQFRREPGPAREHTQAAMKLCDEQGLAFWQPGLLAVDGWATTALGDPRGLARIREGLAAAEAIRTRARRPYFLALLAQACLLAGENDEGLAAVRAAIEQALCGGERFWEAETHRLHGALLAGTDPAGAEARFMTACEVARQQKAKSLELRAATSLARLWAEQGERQKAQDLLAPVYGWFTEGFDTADLKDAKALLDALR
jgi:predicted ATPase